MLNFAKDSIHHPIDGRGAHAIASADGGALKVFNNVFNQWQLNVGGIVYSDEFMSALGVQTDGCVGKYGETY